MNGSRNGTKRFNEAEEINTYLKKMYYDIRNPVAYNSFSKLYLYI